MANIAQTINVLQALILTDGRQTIVTPTGHVYGCMRTTRGAGVAADAGGGGRGIVHGG